MNDNSNASSRRNAFQMLPSVDTLTRTEIGRSVSEELGSERAVKLAREVIEQLRDEVRLAEIADISESGLLRSAEQRLHDSRNRKTSQRQQRVINATGVVIHTNLARAPLSNEAAAAVAQAAAGYVPLEYDLQTGARGRRGGYTEELLCELTGAQSALVVNNCAAAALFVLTVLAAGSDVPISRGELVEIGGDFRVPDILTQSGARLLEVGTTNRTKLSDYSRAINANTKLILRVHPSNYRVVGFTTAPSLKELADLAHGRGLLLYEDAGSGALFELSEMGIAGEPVIRESLQAGADIVTFSGDKLLGGPQCGVIVGRRKLIDELREHPLYRALRVDKMTYAALQSTLEIYTRGNPSEEIPVLKFLAATPEEIHERTERFVASLIGNGTNNLAVTKGESAAGGGSAPTAKLPTSLIEISTGERSADALLSDLRKTTPPVIGRIVNNRVVLDLRTVFENEEKDLANAVASVLGTNQPAERNPT